MIAGRLLIGWIRMEASLAHAPAILSFCMRYAMPYSHWHCDSVRRTVRFDMSPMTASVMQRRCAEAGIGLCVIGRGGLPYLFYRYRHRFGLLIGGLIGMMILLLSSNLLWDIRVSGNESMTAQQVREELRTCGMYVGMPLSELDSAQMEMLLALESDRIAWASINMAGTVAHVEIRERVATPEAPPLQPANLIARHEGVIEGLEIYAGHTVVQAGQAVQQGDLLVSGLYDSQAVGWRVTRAAGRVLARTEHHFTVEIPLKYEEKVYTGEEMCQKTINFFEKEIKLFKNSGILGKSCDKIDNVDTFTLGKGVTLPVSVRNERYLFYDCQAAVRSTEQAQTLAYYELARRISEELPDAMLLRKTLTSTLTDTAFVIHCRVLCLEDIADVREFSVSELSR